MSLRRWLAVFVARNREFLRDRAALGWNILFPVFIVGGFAVAFSGGPEEVFKIGVHGAPESHAAWMETRYIRFVPVEDLDRAVTKVDRHQLDMVLDPAGKRFWVNQTSAKGYMAERVLDPERNGMVRQALHGRVIRYVDWVVPGVLAMNMMWSALYGVGYVIVRYRKNGVLKRLKATPITAFEFLTAQIVSRLWLLIAVSVAVYLGTDFFVGFSMFGSYLNLLLIFVFGAVSMISLGLVIAARIASEELAEGLLNLISWPMMFLSGVWFSLEGVNPVVQKLALIFPLTHLIDGARAVMIDGAGLIDIAPQLTVLGLMSALFIAVGSFAFRWE